MRRVKRVVAVAGTSALMLSVAAFPALAIGDGRVPAGDPRLGEEGCAMSANAVGTPQQGAQGFEGNKTNPGLLQAEPVVGPTEKDEGGKPGGAVSANNPGVSTGAEGDERSAGNATGNCKNLQE